MKGQNGITLIALIITIIVMIILVTVTINVALNGGIFEKAADAKQKTSREVEREKLVAAMIGAYDRTGSFVKPTTLPEGMKWCKKDETYESATEDLDECNYVITEKGELFYVNPNDGTVMDEEPQVNIDDLIPTPEQLSETGEPIVYDGFTRYYFTDGKVVEFFMNSSGMKFVELLVDSHEYYWACNEESAAAYGLEQACTWYDEEIVSYEGHCPFSLETLQNAKNETGYITRVINSFNK